MLSLKLSSVIVCAWLMTACASPPVLSTPPTPLQASLREPCPPLNQLTDGSAASVLRWIEQTAKAYGVCASRHLETVQAWPK